MVAGAGAAAVIALVVSTWLGSLLGGAPPVASDDRAAVGEDRAAATAQSPGVRGSSEPDSAGDREARTESASPGAADPAVDPTADLADATQQLLDARAAAWRSGDPADLEAAHASGSPAREQEAESLANARDLDVTYQGVEFTVGAVAVLAAGPERAVLEVEVERSAYREVTEFEEITHERRSDVVELELRRTEGQWRIWGWGGAGKAQAEAASGEAEAGG